MFIRSCRVRSHKKIQYNGANILLHLSQNATPLNVEIKRSKLPTKKFDAILDGKKVVSFGQRGASDFTIHKDEQRKDRYIQRHRANEDWTNPTTAGF
jgi:hypothetical protein